MITHLVMMKFKPETTDAQIAELESLLKTLPGRIEEIDHYAFGRDVVRSERSYDFGLVATFADRNALGRYQQHPEHLQVVKLLGPICADIKAVDF